MSEDDMHDEADTEQTDGAGGWGLVILIFAIGALDVLLIALCACASADALTPLGLLNFLVLQWFGVRLARVTQSVPPGVWWNYLSVDEREAWLRNHTSYGVRRWVWPLTGWWTDFRWIVRRA